MEYSSRTNPSLFLPRSAREGEAAFSKKMTEGVGDRVRSAPKFAAFESLQSASLTASLMPKGSL